MKPTRNDQFCHSTFQPSTEKLGPSFCTISSGLSGWRVSGSGFAIVVSLCLGDRDDVGFVDELHHLVLDQVDQRDHAFDRVRIAVVLGIGAPVGHGTDETAALLDLAIEVSGRERVDLDQLDLLCR